MFFSSLKFYLCVNSLYLQTFIYTHPRVHMCMLNSIYCKPYGYMPRIYMYDIMVNKFTISSNTISFIILPLLIHAFSGSILNPPLLCLLKWNKKGLLPDHHHSLSKIYAWSPRGYRMEVYTSFPWKLFNT